MKNTTFSLRTEQQGTKVFEGVQVGYASSEDQFHNHESEFVDTTSGNRRNKCSACRWSETTIYKTAAGGFVAHTVGRSIVPGEITLSRLVETSSAFELVELLTVKGHKPYLPAPSSRALAQAAEHDERIRDAYINRAVL